MSVASLPLKPQSFVVTHPAQPTTSPSSQSASLPPGLSRLDILHINDHHEAFTVLPQLITGFHQLSKQLEQQGNAVLKVSTGDNNIGSELKDWQMNIALLNLAHLDAGTSGNHEFDLGALKYAQGLSQANFPLLVSNIDVGPGSELQASIQDGHWRSTATVVEKNGQQFGLIGVTTPNVLKRIKDPETNAKDITVLNMRKTARVVQRQVDALEAAGINKIVLLSHLGYQHDKELIDPFREGVHGIDVIIGGHSHTELTGVQPGVTLFTDSQGAPVIIAQTGKNGHHLGLTSVAFDDNGYAIPLGTQLFTPTDFQADPVAKNIINQVEGPQIPVGTLANAYDNTKVDDQEDPIADAIADEMAREGGADINFVQAATIRDSASAGPLSPLKLRQMLPFPDDLTIGELTGQEILDVLTYLAECKRDGKHHPSLLNTARNFRFVMDAEKGTIPSAQWLNPESGWEPLDPKRTYTVAGDDYIMMTDEYKGLNNARNKKIHPGLDQHVFLKNAMTRYAQQHPEAPAFPLQIDGRLKVFV